MTVGGLALDIINNHDSPSEAFQALRDRFERDGITKRVILRTNLHELRLPIGVDPADIIQKMENMFKKLRSLGIKPDEEEQLTLVHNCFATEYVIEIHQISNVGRTARLQLQKRALRNLQDEQDIVESWYWEPQMEH
ncbi:unnamed protein product [Choristocarpus tenellus]